MRFLKLHTLFFVAVLLVAGYAAVVSLRNQAPLGGHLLSPAAAAAGTTPTPSAATASAPSSTGSATPVGNNDPATAAIQAVIQRANQEQQDAFAKGDPSLMQDTATSEYYSQLLQINRDLASSGVSAIKLVKLEWGPVSLTNPTSAQATTYETWQTSFSDGTTEQSRDRNVYALVQQQGAWRIQADDHPDSGADQAPSPTSPSTTSPAPGGSIPGLVPPAIRIPFGQSGVSRNWSGYAATGGTYTAVTGTWTVPHSQGAAAPSNGSPSGSAPSTGTRRAAGGNGFASSATWVGIGGERSRDLIQAGTEETASGSGRIRYDAWIELLPQNSHPVPLAVSPGDSVTVSISEQGSGQWLIAFTNNTTGQTYQTTVQYTSSHSSAEWVEEAPSTRRQVLPIDNFGTVQFSGGTAVKDGATVSIAQAGARPITLVDPRGNSLAKPSALTSDGKGFSVTQSNSASTAQPGSGLFPSLPTGFPKFADRLGG